MFERLESERYNPNVALEVGYMMALGKPVCLLIRLRHKLQKPSDGTAFERLKDRLFLPEIPAYLGIGLVRDAVRLKDKNLSTLATDLGGKLYRNFDPFNATNLWREAIRKSETRVRRD